MLVFLAVLMTLFVLRLYSVLAKSYSIQEMDWNSDGTTTIAEFFYSSDIDMRSVTLEGKECRQYVAFKDAAVVRTDCQ